LNESFFWDKTILPSLFRPKTVRHVKGEGMPVHSTGSSDPAQRGAAKRGDLYLRFNIIFPSQINEDHKREIEELLD
jgi:DnaJ-class molecular chaperone